MKMGKYNLRTARESGWMDVAKDTYNLYLEMLEDKSIQKNNSIISK